MKNLLVSLILFFLSIAIVSAHVEHAEPSVTSGMWYKIFLWHDYLHPLFFILMIYSCYYFRFFSGKIILREPKQCFSDCSGCYKPEGALKQYHRYFFWGTFVLLFVHIGEMVPSFTIITDMDGIDLLIMAFESLYLLFAFFYLVTCYHFRYVVEILAKKKVISYSYYNALTHLNRSHEVFFWLTISMVAVRFTLVAIETQSILKAIPGTF